MFSGNSISARDKKAHFEGLSDGVPYIGTKDVGFDHNIAYDTGVRIPPQQQARFRRAPAGSVLVCSEGGSAGRKIAQTDRDVFFGNKLFAICPHPGVDSRFIFYFCLSEGFANAFREAMAGLIGGVSLNKFKDLRIPIPTLPEQRRIADRCDEAFGAIDTIAFNIDRNRLNSRQLFEARLAAVFAQSDKGWKRGVTLSSILSAQPRNGWSPPAKYHTHTGTPVLTLSAVTGFTYDGSRVKLSSAPTREDAHYWLKDGELLITRSNTQELVGHVAIYDGEPRRAICCDLIMKMTVDPTKALTRFIYYFLRSPDARSYFTSRAQGASATMKKIGKAIVQNIEVPVPPIPVQEKVVAMLDDLLAHSGELESLYERKLLAVERLKSSLLHHTFTGGFGTER